MRILTTLAATAAFALLATGTGLAAGKAHKLAIHVDQNDPAIMNLALNNAQNVKSFYEAEGDTVTIEIVAYGPGLTMYTTDSPVKVRSLTTIGTPWQGSYLSDYANDLIPITECKGDKFCQNGMKDFKALVLKQMSGSGREVNKAFLMGSSGWNEFQSGVLDRIPVVLIAGNRFKLPGPANPGVWPNDGLVAEESALAKSIGDPILPHRRCHTFDDTHSIYVSDQVGLKWDTALTWDPQVLDVVHQSIQDAPKALDSANREGCPAA